MALSCNPKLLGGKVRVVGVRIPVGKKIPINSDLCVHDVEKVSMACRACDHYLWKSLNLLKRVLVADGKNLKGGGFDSPWGEVQSAPQNVSPQDKKTISRQKIFI